MSRPWMLGNTTVRSALRLKIGLDALVASGLVGNLGRENETAFALALDEHGVVSLSEETEDVSSLGRKWRSALGKLGFIVPKVPARLRGEFDKIGQQYTITENGYRLISAESVPAIQEVFLRAIAAVQVPSPLDSRFEQPPFTPLKHVLRVMIAMQDSTGDSHLTPVEMATIVQLVTPSLSSPNIAARILDLRARRDNTQNKVRFDKDERELAAVAAGVTAGTLHDYADLNFRYLKATGLVQGKGRGIALVPEQETMAEMLVGEPEVELSEADYLFRLCRGAALPTDNRSGAIVVFDQLVESARARGIDVDVDSYDLTQPANIAVARHDVEAEISKSKEVDYAAEQAGRISEILAIMRLIITRATSTTVDGEEVSVPKDERPAYFEWIVWRAFLAINHLTVQPHEVRRFKIDQDFLPVGTAPGGGADVVAEFEDFVLVVEVTLTESSRQEAAEGEPVRRHVADGVLKHLETGKTVYGLFLANRIDSNTAETFRIGRWYLKDDSPLVLDIAPFTLAQFRELVASMFAEGNVHPNIIREKIQAAVGMRHLADGAPEWKANLEELLPVSEA